MGRTDGSSATTFWIERSIWRRRGRGSMMIPLTSVARRCGRRDPPPPLLPSSSFLVLVVLVVLVVLLVLLVLPLLGVAR